MCVRACVCASTPRKKELWSVGGPAAGPPDHVDLPVEAPGSGSLTAETVFHFFSLVLSRPCFRGSCCGMLQSHLSSKCSVAGQKRGRRKRWRRERRGKRKKMTVEGQIQPGEGLARKRNWKHVRRRLSSFGIKERNVKGNWKELNWMTEKKQIVLVFAQTGLVRAVRC